MGVSLKKHDALDAAVRDGKLVKRGGGAAKAISETWFLPRYALALESQRD